MLETNEKVKKAAEEDIEGDPEEEFPVKKLWKIWSDPCTAVQTEDDKEILFEFWDKMVPVVSKCTSWNKSLKKNPDMRLPSKAFTVTDEAFTLLLVDNHFKQWLDLFEHGRNLKTYRSKYLAKYTEKDDEGSPGEATADRSKRGGRKTWSSEGMKQYNKLVLKVMVEREGDPEVNKPPSERRLALEKEFAEWLVDNDRCGMNSGSRKRKARNEDDEAANSAEMSYLKRKMPPGFSGMFATV